MLILEALAAIDVKETFFDALELFSSRGLRQGASRFSLTHQSPMNHHTEVPFSFSMEGREPNARTRVVRAF
jgi:hypothetical protein